MIYLIIIIAIAIGLTFVSIYRILRTEVIANRNQKLPFLIAIEHNLAANSLSFKYRHNGEWEYIQDYGCEFPHSPYLFRYELPYENRKFANFPWKKLNNIEDVRNFEMYLKYKAMQKYYNNPVWWNKLKFT